MMPAIALLPAGYSGSVYIQWVGTVFPIIGAAGSDYAGFPKDIESSGTDYTSIKLLSNSAYKYLAYPTYESQPDLGMYNYNFDIATADMFSDAANKNRKKQIYCYVLLEDGSWGKSNVMEFTSGWTDSGSGSSGPGAEDQAAADRVQERIDLLSDPKGIGLYDEEDVASIRAAYEALTDTQKYTGSASKNFAIAKKSIKPAVVLSAADYIWDNKVKKPGVTVSDGSTRLAASQYTVTYAGGRKNIGSYRVTVTLKGNYSGSNYAAFNINPKGAAIAKPVAAKKGFTAKWKKQTGKMPKSRITGYQVQYSTNRNFKTGAKTVKVKGYKKTSRKITRLKSRKTYYVRVRTYMTTGGKTYCSGWSKVKKVRTK